MVEYLHDAIKAVSGQNIDISAFIEDTDGTPITEDCALVVHDKDRETMIGRYEGSYIPELEMWAFTIPAFDTFGLKGRYWYCIQHKDSNMCFTQPLYLV